MKYVMNYVQYSIENKVEMLQLDLMRKLLIQLINLWNTMVLLYLSTKKLV